MREIVSLFDHPLDKNILYQHFFRTLYNNASKVILIKGLPDDADYDFIMSQLLLVGRISVFEDKGKVYLLNGHIGGAPDEYYYPTRVLIANPILGSFDLERDKKAVMVYLTPTDRLLDVPKVPTLVYGGLFSLISMVANILSECMTTVNTTLMNTRVHAIYTADTESAARSAEPVLKSIYEGKPFSVVTSELLERLNVNPLSEHGLSNCLIETLEVCQYVLSLFWNGIGIDANYNMKRERLITAEVDKNVQSLIVPIQTILETLNSGFNKANKIFGTTLEAILNPKFAIEQEKESNNGTSSTDANSNDISSSDTNSDDTTSTDNEQPIRNISNKTRVSEKNDMVGNDEKSITADSSTDESRTDFLSGHRLSDDNVEKTDDEKSTPEENCSGANQDGITIVINNNNGNDNNNTNEIKGDDENENQDKDRESANDDNRESDKNKLEVQKDKSADSTNKGEDE